MRALSSEHSSNLFLDPDRRHNENQIDFDRQLLALHDFMAEAEKWKPLPCICLCKDKAEYAGDREVDEVEAVIEWSDETDQPCQRHDLSTLASSTSSSDHFQPPKPTKDRKKPTEILEPLERMPIDRVKELSKPIFEIENQVMTVKEAAKFLKLTTKTIYKKVSREEIPHKKVGGEIRFLFPQLIRWLKGEIHE